MLVSRPSPAPRPGWPCARPAGSRRSARAPSSESSKSKTSRFSSRRSCPEAFGIAATCGWSSSQRSATWPADLPWRRADLAPASRRRHPAVGERRVGGHHQVALGPASTGACWPRNGWYSTWSHSRRREPSARAGARRGSSRRRCGATSPSLAQGVHRDERSGERHLRARPVQQEQVDVARAEAAERPLARGAHLRRRCLSCQTFVVSQISSRAHAGVRSPARPRARSRRPAPCRCGGSRSQRVAHASRASSPSIRQVPKPSAGTSAPCPRTTCSRSCIQAGLPTRRPPTRPISDATLGHLPGD